MYDDKLKNRFFAQVIKMESGCHEWSGCKDKSGYGYFSVGARTVKAHRVAYMIANDTHVPSAVCVCHTCDNPKCVNPEHLWLGSVTQNNLDRTRKGRTSRKGAPPKLTDEQVITIVQMLSSGEHSLAEVARHFGVSRSLVCLIRKGQVRKGTSQDLDLTATSNFKKQKLSGHNNPNAKLSLEDIQEVFSLRAAGFSQQKIADRLGVTQTCISRVLRTQPT